MRKFLLFSVLICTISCQNPSDSNIYDYGEEFELELGEEAKVSEANITVEFVDVLEDSRCPSNVTCVWAGNGKVQIRLDQEDLRLNTYLKPKEAVVSKINIQLISLEPYPEHPRQFEKEDYKVRLLITEK